ncbi:SLAP domain-containing protein [Ureibacillus manganicus]|uniref:SLAP domain-containing protein n=1 Tax=Ureibacillus manganicus DSM 26584 TaxID=1384049 RepID=A0A0A3I5R8_9BACL|nr:SLAP domain-containing protein [Ureibacillus manganicus]KGR78043.1 hypothetical protein CD29_12880 [Ureibacillus manganicus DSM 26584]
MQKLQFETSWDKALAAEDRQQIEKLFHNTKKLNSSEILFSRIRVAINHKDELLVTVLVHNFSDRPLDFINKRLIYSIQGEVIGDSKFTLPALVIQPRVSIPWTFIFPKETYTEQPSYETGQITIQ